MIDTDLCRAFDILDERIFPTSTTWGKYQYFNRATGQMCLVGGCLEAAREILPLSPQGLNSSMEQALYTTLLRGDTMTRSYRGVVSFNDDPKTTFDDVKRVIKATRTRVCAG